MNKKIEPSAKSIAILSKCSILNEWDMKTTEEIVQEELDKILKQQKLEIVKMLEGMKRPIYFDNHGAPTEEDDLVRNHMVDQAIKKIKEMDA